MYGKVNSDIDEDTYQNIYPIVESSLKGVFQRLLASEGEVRSFEKDVQSIDSIGSIDLN